MEAKHLQISKFFDAFTQALEPQISNLVAAKFISKIFCYCLLAEIKADTLQSLTVFEDFSKILKSSITNSMTSINYRIKDFFSEIITYFSKFKSIDRKAFNPFRAWLILLRLKSRILFASEGLEKIINI